MTGLMKRVAAALCVAGGLALAGTPALAGDPAVGDVIEFDGQTMKVVGAGTEPFEAIANGDSYIVVIDWTQAVGVIVPPAGAVLKLDPSVPMMTIDGKAYPPFESSYLKRNGKGHPYMLLEIVR